MNTSVSNTTPRPPLRGPRIQYSDGTVVTPPPLDVEEILARLRLQEDATRSVFLSVFAHSLTVDIRAILLDRPVSDIDLDRVSHINEFLHQLTSGVNPAQRRSGSGDAELVGVIIDTSYIYHLESAVGRALSTAAGTAGLLCKESSVAQGTRSVPSDDLPPYSDVERELLLLLFRTGGERFSRKADEVYSPLADIFGLNREQRSRLRADREESLWNNRVQWARRKLVEGGLMLPGPRGVWRLTESGRQKAELMALRHH